jgi:hypothetical protein
MQKPNSFSTKPEIVTIKEKQRAKRDEEREFSDPELG